MITAFFSSCLQLIIVTISFEFLPEIDVKPSDFQNINIFFLFKSQNYNFSSFSLIQQFLFSTNPEIFFFKKYSTNENNFNKEVKIFLLTY